MFPYKNLRRFQRKPGTFIGDVEKAIRSRVRAPRRYDECVHYEIFSQNEDPSTNVHCYLGRSSL